MTTNSDRRHRTLLFLLLVVAPVTRPTHAADAAAKIPPTVYHRTVFLGDSITDGNTYPQLVRDALADAGLPKMVAINAGIGGDTAAGMRGRLERDVLAFHPMLVTLSAGANDALRHVSSGSYEKDIRAIADRLKAEHVPLILLTPNILGPKQQAKGQKNLDAYEAILRQVAADYGLRVAEVNRRQKEALAGGIGQLAPDDLHPNWAGQTMIARAVLDSMGYGEVKVPQRIAGRLLPGVIGEWKVKRLDEANPDFTEAFVADVKPEASWMTLKLPDPIPIPDMASDNRWLDDYRVMGAAVALRQRPAGSYVGMAIVRSEKQTAVQFHTGATLDQVWLNGKRIYKNDWKHGYHIGRESVTAELKQGENAIVIKTGPVFFLSITDGAMWEEKGE
ncbi:MAG TPA: GDSL-type esterase/lipase family protein [Tepidisphaeraceae bacterium]|jgi:lysophospholipase L1-like esterase|nr:GDSL-type esterase/lipase family protein [Tepidisphaeraceae bacterium]